MKTKLIILGLAICFLGCVGQAQNIEQKVKVGAFFAGLCPLDSSFAQYSGSEFIGLFVENGKFHLRPTIVDLVELYHDGHQAVYQYLLSRDENSLFLFSYFIGYNPNPIEAVNGGRGIAIMPGDTFNFTYNGISYTFQADGEMDWRSNISNYTLSFSKTGCQTKQILVSHAFTEDGYAIILFIGDLDGDGKPDIILNGTHHYEFSNIMLFLSSTAEDGNLLRLEGGEACWVN